MISRVLAGHKLSEDFYSSSTSGHGSKWNGQCEWFDLVEWVEHGVEHSLHVALLDQVSGNVLGTDALFLV